MDKEQIKALLQGSYDLHIHPTPSHFPREFDDFELVEQATDYGMAGVMLKSHYESTAGRAALVNRRMGNVAARAYGGIVLNWPAGGLNPYAVESALRLGAAFVWMPTRDAQNCLRYGDMEGDFFSRTGISVLDQDKKLLPVIHDIFDVVKEHDRVLATGHISPVETMALCKAGRAAGVRMVLTHPEWERTIISKELQCQLADMGVIIEKCWYNIAAKTCTAGQMAQSIRAVGAHRSYMTTDRGQAGAEAPTQAMMLFADTLLKQGISYGELELMMKTVPSSLVCNKI